MTFEMIRRHLYALGLCIASFCLFAQTTFVDQASSVGIGYSCGSTFLGTGVSFVDYNKDGWDDLTFATESTLPVRFFKNIGGTFVEEFFTMPPTLFQTKQVNWIDFDNDGDYDLFITSDTNADKLFENDGNMNFTDISASAGFPTTTIKSFGASWGDINNDGYLDVFISVRDNLFVQTNMLFRNNGNGTFTDISTSAGINSSSLSFCSAFIDYDMDGDQDIYVSNDKDYVKNLLFRNNGNETFTEVGGQSGTNVSIDAMSTTIGDYNKDGFFDIYVTNTPDGNVLLKNNGNGTYSDQASASSTTFNSIGWGAVFIDAENDSDLDLYVSGSLDGSTPGLKSSAFYENNDDGTFTDATSTSGFVGDNAASFSNAVGDIDNDGFPELAVTNNGIDNVFLWKNNNTSFNNWLKVNLEGTTSNRDGIGSIIEIATNGNKQYRYTLNGEGYLSQNSKVEHFGLGTSTMVDYVKVTWLSGTIDIINNVPVNQVINITEGATLAVPDEIQQAGIRIFPNPANDHLKIRSINEIDHVIIRDITGRNVLFQLTADLSDELNISELSAGTYFVEVFSNERRYTTKIIIK